MPLFPKINGAHKEMTDCKVKVEGEWKQALEMLVKVNGKWKNVWSNVAIYIVTDTQYEIFEVPFNIAKTPVVLNNFVVKAYDRNDKLIDTMVYEKEQTGGGSYLVYNAKSYGEVGIQIDVENKKFIFSISIDFAESEARKLVMTIDKITYP